MRLNQIARARINLLVERDYVVPLLCILDANSFRRYIIESLVLVNPLAGLIIEPFVAMVEAD